MRLLERAVALTEADTGQSYRVDLLRRMADALERLGQWTDARAVAEVAVTEMPDDTDPMVAGRLLIRMGDLKALDDPEASISIRLQAVSHLERMAPSAELAIALHQLQLSYASRGDMSVGRPLLDRALAVAEQAGDRGVTAMVLVAVSANLLRDGRVGEGLAACARARRLATEPLDPEGLHWVSVGETDAYLKLCDLERVLRIGMADVRIFDELGPWDAWGANIVLHNVAEALIGLGRPTEVKTIATDAEADAVPPIEEWPLQELRCVVDVCAGRLDDAARRMRGVMTRAGTLALDAEHKRELATTRCLIALWRSEPRVAEEIARQTLGELTGTEEQELVADLLVLLAQAEANLANQLPKGGPNVSDDSSWSQAYVADVAADPFADHPLYRSRPAQKITWLAEQARRARTADPELWAAATTACTELGMPHKVAYSAWRHAEAMLAFKAEPAALKTVLANALVNAAQHEPLPARIRDLAQAARVTLDVSDRAPAVDAAGPPLGLTQRELEVLRLLMVGSTNAEIGNRLYMSPKTASVHVTSIMRKLGASNRTQAARIARQAGIDDRDTGG